MIIDARTLPNETALSADVCIVGAGAAGLAIARSMSGKPWKVLLLESGGLNVDGRTQTLYAGDNVGLPYERLATARSRYFGGSTNCWGGFCRPFEPIDLEARDGLPNSGWPFGASELAPYLRGSHEILNLGEPAYDTADWAEMLRPQGIGFLPIDGGPLENRVARISDQPRVGASSHDVIRAAPNVTCCMNANALEFVTNDTASVVTRVRCATLNGVRFSVGARLFILCCGGIENVRLLMLSNRVQEAGLGNGNDLVGRYFTDHPRIKSTAVRLADQKRHRRLYDMTLCLSRRRLNATSLPIMAALGPTAATQRAMGLLNSRTYLVAQYHGEATAGFRALRELKLLLSDRRKFGASPDNMGAVLRDTLPSIATHLPDLAYAVFDNVVNPDWVQRRFALETVMEPVPNPDSRVTLGTERDELGLNRPVVDWRLTAKDREDFLRTHDLIRQTLTEKGLILSEGEPGDAEQGWEERKTWCWHHMGTTRMDDDPARGVVDSQCRVHGVHNLYVGGSSVFPAMGSDHPTINLVALALRLSDRLAGEMERCGTLELAEGQKAA